MKANKEDLTILLEALSRQRVEKIIAFSGGSECNGSAEVLAEESLALLKDYRIAIVNGGTAWGLSKYTTQSARRLGIPVIGVYPTRGERYAIKDLDFALEVEPRFGDSEWGDATEIFSKLVHGAEVIEGGLCTAVEFAYLMKVNVGRISHNQEPVYVVPIMSESNPRLNTVANMAHLFPIKKEVAVACMPDFEVYNGRAAAEYLVRKLKLSRR
ncbi:MAG: hypothetical protein Q8Q31_05700 [Nanoarchaeota archaeon]|nr:hypothetical protein [Nanoarchaeota archaeon]